MWDTWMRRALALAALADGVTSPNPLVGAVVLDRHGQLVGEGFHARAGEPHAEVGAIAQAGDRAKGGTLVVTLEPCCHHGRTPPCSEAVLRAGITRVVIALEDPDPRVAGGGIARLRASGIEVLSKVLQAEAAAQNRAFLHRVRTGRPWGILKWAMGLDGRIALSNGASQWITGPSARRWVHCLRAKCDAVIVGGGTVRADDPLLTSRGRRMPEPLRVVLSRSLDLPATAHLWDTAVAPTLVVHGPEAMKRSIPCGPQRHALSACEPEILLQELAVRGCNCVLWECGPGLSASAIKQGCIQEVVAVVAPKLMGGESACTPIDDLGFTKMNQVVVGTLLPPKSYGEDWLFSLRIDR
ncbi:bifunctional diaminohydroxyphosphoribosylaminopyrimidine deaminase/5-amino-6-(5-phosphoribosylamino)uracil reductase RibD [Synechococcus sp. M16CYN]|uniref:bifunctional diaminohydroxyphosphoribosylaminopyrimidine deaminase/5-amino-6-(5-phosphoribosylamino)uracil reductase RibD n=1 Tax=Synechococcus sp. M16CYN TaxID=3103139 RepID=UPI003246768E